LASVAGGGWLYESQASNPCSRGPSQALLGRYRPSADWLVLLGGLLGPGRYFSVHQPSRLGPTLLVAGSPPPPVPIRGGVTGRIGGMSRRSRIIKEAKGVTPHYQSQLVVGKVVARGAGGLLSAFRDGLWTPPTTRSSGRVRTPTQSSGRVQPQTQSSGRVQPQTQSSGQVQPPTQSSGQVQSPTTTYGQVRGGTARPVRGRGRGPNRGVESGRPRNKALPRYKR